MRVFTIASLAIATTLAMATVSAAADGSAAEKEPGNTDRSAPV